MNVLLDTHALLWFAAGEAQLPRRARQTIESRSTVCYVSMASWWEIAIKVSLNRLRLDEPLEDFISDRTDEGFRTLPIEAEHVLEVRGLHFHHRDPFDRMLVAQALVEQLPVITGDEAFARYGIETVW